MEYEETMAQRVLNSAGIYVLIAFLLALSAIFKTISADPWVVNFEWLSAIIFALVGLWRAKRRRRLEEEAEAEQEELEAEEEHRMFSNRE
jgi:large-conductance mechanosensitive channel